MTIESFIINFFVLLDIFLLVACSYKFFLSFFYLGSKIRNNSLPSPEILCCTQVVELKRVTQDTQAITVGSAVTFAQMEEFLQETLKETKGGYI